MNEFPAYGLWPMVITNSALFIFFAFSFTKPKTRLDWRSLGVFSAFIVALFTEMYGFPLSIYFLSGWLQSTFPETNIFAHDNGHLWYTLFGFEGDPHLNPIHLLSNVLLLTGFLVVAKAWGVLHKAQKEGVLAQSGLYSIVRHPQYIGFSLVMAGFLFMWPTLITIVMFPVLIIVYHRLAKKEEEIVRGEFGCEYDQYAATVPAFIPRMKTIQPQPPDIKFHKET